MKQRYIIAIDQSTSATKAMLFSSRCQMLRRVNVPHRQIYPQAGWVEHDAEEIYLNMMVAIEQLLEQGDIDQAEYSLAITNQRETAVVWNRFTGKPIAHAVVWQDMRGEPYCNELKAKGLGEAVRQRTGLLIDPYFSASGVKWLLDHVEGARQAAEQGDLMMGTMDCWLVWKLTHGKVHATDYTNASRTLLFNIHTMQWDEGMLHLFNIPRSMMPEVKPCDACFGTTDLELKNGTVRIEGVPIAGVLGDSHGALVGQMCFDKGLGKATYGTGSSVMIHIGEEPLTAPQGQVTSVAYAAQGKVCYAYEGNIHCTGATLKWMQEQLQLIASPMEAEAAAMSIKDNRGVYFVPAFVGLGAPWWNSKARAAIIGMSLATGKAEILRAALESIAYQVCDLIEAMVKQAGLLLKELRVDGGPSRNRFLMQLQSNCLGVPVNCSDVEEASALGAVVMNGLALGLWQSLDEVAALRKSRACFLPNDEAERASKWHQEWLQAIAMVNR